MGGNEKLIKCAAHNPQNSQPLDVLTLCRAGMAVGGTDPGVTGLEQSPSSGCIHAALWGARMRVLLCSAALQSTEIAVVQHSSNSAAAAHRGIRATSPGHARVLLALSLMQSHPLGWPGWPLGMWGLREGGLSPAEVCAALPSVPATETRSALGWEGP